MTTPNSETQGTPPADVGPGAPNRQADERSHPTLTEDHLSFLNGLQAAFRGSQPNLPNTVDSRREKLKTLSREVDDFTLSRIRSGAQGAPLTSKIAHELSETSEHLFQENHTLKTQIAALQKQTNLIQDPNYRGIVQIQDSAELMITDAVDALYGTIDPSTPKAAMSSKMKDHQKDSFHTMVSDHLNDLIEKNDFKSIKALQKPSNLRALISDLGEHVLPPKARDVLKAEALANRPIDPQALYQEMREANTKAKDAKSDAERRQWEDIATRARRRYLGTRIGKK